MKLEQWQELLNQPENIPATGLITSSGRVRKHPSIQRAFRRLKTMPGAALEQVRCTSAPSHPLSWMASSPVDHSVEQLLQGVLAPRSSRQQVHAMAPLSCLDGASFSLEPDSLDLQEVNIDSTLVDSAGPLASEFADDISFEMGLNFKSAMSCQWNTPLFTAGGHDISGMGLDSSVDGEWQTPSTAHASTPQTSLARRASLGSPFQLFLDDHHFFGSNLEPAQLENYLSRPAATTSSPGNPNDLFTSTQPRANETFEGGIFDSWPHATGFEAASHVVLPAGFTEKWMKALPFSNFEEYMRSQNITFTKTGSTTQQRFGTSFSGSFAIRSLARSLHSGSQPMAQHQSGSQTPLQKLENLLPRESSAIMSGQQMTETRLVRTLLFSMMNGFAGLNHIPIEDILKSMAHFSTSKLLLQILEEGPPFTSRTLGDNMFRAAIEAKDQRIVQVLLERKLVDVNDTVCFFQNKRYTPVERAASLQAHGLIRTLAEAGADVNKTHGDETYPGALRKLLQVAAGPRRGYLNYQQQPTATSDLIETLDILIGKGAKVDLELLRVHLNSFMNKSEVAYLISRSIPFADHQHFFEYDDNDGEKAQGLSLVGRTAEELDDNTAVTIIQNMIDLCKRAGCSRCLEKWPKQIEAAAVEGAKRGHFQVVQLLIGHVQSTTTILSAAIRHGNNDLIRLVLGTSTKPKLNPEAHLLGRLPYSYRAKYRTQYRLERQQIYDLLPTTPLAEAVRTGNADLIKILEGSGALKNLATGGRLEALIFAAAEGGNVPYMKYLLKIASSSSQKYRPHCLAVCLALENSHDEVAKVLLLAGAEVTCIQDSWNRLVPGVAVYECINALGVALLQKRDSALVHAVLSSDIGGLSENDMKDVASWFDLSILSDIVSVFPDSVCLPGGGGSAPLYDICKRCMETENVAFFKIFLESVSSPRAWLDPCLAIATEMGHAEMVNLLLQMGADPFGSRVLKAAIPERPEMLKILFEEDRKQPTSQKCVGARILKFVMAERPGNTEVLSGLLDRKLVNLIVPEAFEEKGYTGELLTPLGLAIIGASGYCETNIVAINQLLQAGCDPNKTARILTVGTRVSETALMLAIKTGREDVVQLLLKYGADVNKETFLTTKRTPLQCAAEQGDLDMVRLLLKKGVDVNEEPAVCSGGTALQFAAISGNVNVVAELLERGAQLHALPSKVNGRWPLEGASENGRLDMIEFLWKAKGISLNGAGFQKRQCLRSIDFARSNGHLGCRDLITELSGFSEDLLDSEEYGVPWLAY